MPDCYLTDCLTKAFGTDAVNGIDYRGQLMLQIIPEYSSRQAVADALRFQFTKVLGHGPDANKGEFIIVPPERELGILISRPLVDALGEMNLSAIAEGLENHANAFSNSNSAVMRLKRELRPKSEDYKGREALKLLHDTTGITWEFKESDGGRVLRTRSATDVEAAAKLTAELYKALHVRHVGLPIDLHGGEMVGHPYVLESHFAVGDHRSLQGMRTGLQRQFAQAFEMPGRSIGR